MTILSMISSCRGNNSIDFGENSSVRDTSSSIFKDRNLIDSLKNASIYKGDYKAYDRLASYYFVEDMKEEFLYIALQVANKYNYPKACFEVYRILIGWPSENKQVDNTTKKLALYYLLKSYDGGYETAKLEIAKASTGDEKYITEMRHCIDACGGSVSE